MERHQCRLAIADRLMIGEEVVLRIEGIGFDRWERTGWARFSIVSPVGTVVYMGTAGKPYDPATIKAARRSASRRLQEARV